MTRRKPNPLPRYSLTWEGADLAVNDAAALFMVPRCMRWLIWSYLPLLCLLFGASVGSVVNAIICGA